MSVRHNLLILIVILYLITEITTKFEFTNLQCECVDKDFCGIDYCYLKSINRTYKYASVKIHLLKPITNIMINAALYKRLNGYKPWLYNITVDGCKFINNRRLNPIANYLFGFLGTKHNMNHSCPYYHDIIVDKVPISEINHHVTAILPIPEGAYLLNAHAIINGTIRYLHRVYGTIS